MVLERFDAAATHATHAVQRMPNDPIVLYRAASAIRWSDCERARALLDDSKRLIVANPSLRAALRPDFDHLERLIEHGAGNLTRATRHFERAFHAEPGGIGVGADLAVAYLEQGRREEALSVIATSLQHHPNNRRLLELQRQAQDATGRR